jgi:hypothetical protein
MVDELKVGTSVRVEYWLFPLGRIERIEVLREPAGREKEDRK